ncbi:hypothetical protein BV20DRAFT_968673 [Pilatotrama ljubarskyi]|nr:hypothetical protein BV20DRAFT_968673 [Pilatotrama ljubarskyi]
MRGQKRRLSPESPRKDRTKRPTVAPIDISDYDDGEDSLQSILAQIKAQEESEALAKRLHQEWNAPGPSNASGGPSGSRACGRVAPDGDGDGDDVIVISDDDVEMQEDDEAVARRLAKEWEVQDVVPDGSPSNSSSNPPSVKGKARSRSDSGAAQWPAAVLEQYKDLFRGERTCSCGAKLPSPRGPVMYSQQVPLSGLLRLLHVQCKSCKTSHCRGCMSPVSCSPLCKGKTHNEDCRVETCCADVRIVALYEALGAFDRQYLAERATANERAQKAAATSRKKQVGSVGPGGTGYGSGRGGSYSYGDDYDAFLDCHEDVLLGYSSRVRSRGRGRGRSGGRGASSARPDNSDQHDPTAIQFDQIILAALKTITDFLPCPYSENTQIYDMLPHPAIGSLLLLSQLPDLLATLLRNDSVTDWISRIDVYHSVFSLLRRMADCELTLEVLVGPRWEMSRSCGLEDWMWGDGEIIWETDSEGGEPIPAPPLYAHFKKLTKQCETFLSGASSMLESASDGEDTENMVKAASLCGDIIAVKDDLERAMIAMGKDPTEVLKEPPRTSSPASRSAAKGKGKDPDIDMERTYARECERLAFQHVSLSRPASDGAGLDYPGYYYARELTQTANATRNPKDRLHLVKELAVMATSLPPGVWVRVDEVRNDALKIMIAGPEGTPYAGGLFEFDCFIPLEYPNKPPLMHLRTTGGGTVRFNPNLYSNGKVCLSLLGTWQGRPEEQWAPRKSTLLQVVVSIQSMILVDLPYFNEPGFGRANPRNQASIHYNKNIIMQTTRWAIVDWLRDEHKDGLWREVISSHFLTRHDKVKKCIRAWAIEEPGMRNYRCGPTESIYMPQPMGGGIIMPMPPPLVGPWHSTDDLSRGHMDVTAPLAGSSVSGNQGWFPIPVSPLSHIPNRRRRVAESATPPPAVDLLTQYDEGIQRVRAWGPAEAM